MPKDDLLDAIVECPKCKVPVARIERQQVPGAPPGHWENITHSIRPGVRGKRCPDCDIPLERSRG